MEIGGGSKRSDADHRSVTSEELTLDSALLVSCAWPISCCAFCGKHVLSPHIPLGLRLQDNQSLIMGQGGRTNVELSRMNSISLTDALALTRSIVPSDAPVQDPSVIERLLALARNIDS